MNNRKRFDICKINSFSEGILRKMYSFSNEIKDINLRVKNVQIEWGGQVKIVLICGQNRLENTLKIDEKFPCSA